MIKENNTKNYLMLISSMLIFGTIGIFRRFIPLSSAMLACTRGILGASFLLIFIKARGHKIGKDIDKRNIVLLIITGAIIAFNWIFLFEAYNHTSVAVATLCYYMAPTIVVILSPFAFKEHLSLRKIICVITAIIGMVMISGVLTEGQLAKADIKGICYGLIAAVLYATVIILNKKVKMEDAYEKTLIQLAAAAVVLIPYILLTENLYFSGIDFTALILILIVGIIHTGIAYVMYFGSMNESSSGKGLKAQSVALISYIDPVSALILSAIFLKETLSIFGIIGAIMIIGAAAISER